jgi:hypothetical protein
MIFGICIINKEGLVPVHRLCETGQARGPYVVCEFSESQPLRHLLNLDTSAFYCNLYVRIFLPEIVEVKGSTTDELYAFDAVSLIRSKDAVQEL